MSVVGSMRIPDDRSGSVSSPDELCGGWIPLGIAADVQGVVLAAQDLTAARQSRVLSVCR